MGKRRLHFQLLSECAHENVWPCIDIVVNSELKFSGFVESRLLIDIDFDSYDSNCISLFYKNKRFGPDCWDTEVDSNGNIVKDQHVQIETIRIDECNLNFLIREIPYITLSGEKIYTNGYLGYNGHFNFEYSEPYYDWVHDTRLSLVQKQNYKITDSSLPFITNYVYTNNDKVIDDLLKQLQNTIDNAKKFNYNNSISGTT